MSITNTALLVSVTIRQWEGNRLDKLETQAVEIKHKTSARAARVHKSLLPNATELKEVLKAGTKIRQFVYKHTLPWGDGVQILRTMAYMQFTQDLGTLSAEYDNKVRHFIAEYPRLIREAQHDLGTMFDLADYPEQSKLREKFAVDVRYMPVPEAGDWRVELTQDQMKDLRDSVTRQVTDAQEKAMRTAWDRLFTVIEKAHEKLSSPDAEFRDSLIHNITDLCAVLPQLNITNDPKLEAMRKVIEKSVVSKNPKALRKDANLRGQAATEMQKIMTKMSAMYGGVS